MLVLVLGPEVDDVVPDGKLVKKRGILGKMVVLYQPMPKLLESLTKQGLLKK